LIGFNGDVAMKKLFTIGVLVLACAGSWAQTDTNKLQGLSGNAKARLELAVCKACGTVQNVKQENRKGKGGILGVAGGAVVGGLLGNQIGKGNGNTIATVGGAVVGGLAGNEVQKRATSKKVWVTSVKMKDGSLRNFEQVAQPAWVVGSVVKINGTTLTKQ
jgi:outer membrane lipoprotein SlyB